VPVPVGKWIDDGDVCGFWCVDWGIGLSSEVRAELKAGNVRV